MKNSRTLIETPYALSEARFILFKSARSITPATTYSGSATPSTLIPDIMLRSPVNEEGAEPYWYARVLGVYHANVWAENSVIPGARNVRRMDFLWVRWFGEEPGYRSGFRRARLPKIGFVESSDEFAFSFVNPADVVRGCHLIPAFNAGRPEC